MKKIILFIILLLPISIKASESFIVMDADSLRVLGGKNINEELLIASTTKLMTSLVALENSETTDVLCAGEEILSVYGSMIYIDQNECMTLYDLLMGLNLRSGNDAAMVIATHTIGYDNFINEMNNMSSKLGLNNTHFSNPHGLDNKTKNTSTAYDLGLLMSYLTKNKTFMNITGTKKYTITTASTIKNVTAAIIISLLLKIFCLFFFIKCIPYSFRNSYTKSSIFSLVNLMCHKCSCPDEVIVIIILILGSNPAKEDSLSVQFKSTSCIIRSAVKCIIFRCDPWTFQTLAHTVYHFTSVTVFCHNMIPPVTNLK